MRHLHLAAAAAFALSACVAPDASPDAPEETGRNLYEANCAACHGDDATGSGEMGRQLTFAPPDLTRISARNGGVFPRDAVMSQIDGYSRGDHGSAAMPEFGAGDLGPTVVVENADGTSTPVPVNLLLLADYLQGIQR